MPAFTIRNRWWYLPCAGAGGRRYTGHWQRGENLLTRKMLVVPETELWSQCPVTLNKLNIQMPERKEATLLRDSETGKAGSNASFPSAVCLDRHKSPLGYLKWVIQS